VRPDDTVFDVGAAYGMYTLPLADLVGPGGRVFAFEPQPRQSTTAWTYARLIGADQVTVTRAVMGDREDAVTLQVPIRFGVPIYGHAHVVEGTDPAHAPKRARRIPIPMLTVDGWLREHRAPGPVSFLKVDVEGFEPAVLAGARETIERWRPSLLLEIEDRHLRRYGDDGNAFADRIRTQWPEYRMYARSGDGWQAADRVDLTTRNYLFASDAAFERRVTA
jgi:FkbM family methyltransferase